MTFEKSDFTLFEIPVDLPVFTTILTDHLEFSKYLKETIIEHRKKHPQSNTSNVKSWHSAWNTHEINSKFKPLTDRVESACSMIASEYYNNQINFYVKDLWAMMYDEGDYAKKHNHYPEVLSSIYYVDVESTSSPIIFENNHGKSLTIHPQNGMLLIWSSLIDHMVFPTDSKRMLISMNVNPQKVNREKTGEPLYSTSDRF